MMRPIFLLLATAALLTADEPIQQAAEGRLWLKVPESQPPLANIQVSAGSATQAPWEKDSAVRERLTDVIFPIRWWDWSEVSITFTATQDQTVELVLNGPWSQGKDGQPFRQEILWDDIRGEGADIANGGFETGSDAGPESWNSLYGPYLTSNAWPIAGAEALEGKSLAASCQNRPLSQTFHVKAGQPVTLRLHAKSATPPGFIAPKILGKNTPAHKAAASIRRGVNLGNCWEAPPPYTWGVRYTPEDIDRIAAEGFDHIRVPVAWQFYLKEGASGLEIDPSLLTDLEPVLRHALEKKLHILLDWHHFNELTDNPVANRTRFIRGWETIARHFSSWPPELFFELLNEPRDALTTEVANPIYEETITAIRKISPERIIFVSPGKWGDIHELEKLRLPDGDDRLVATVHCYEPFYFTHQKAGWVQLGDLAGISYPGPPQTPLAVPASFQENAKVRNFINDYNTTPADRNPSSSYPIGKLFDIALAWSDHFGRPVHLGEFGSHNMGDSVSRSRYTRDVRSLAEARKIPWTLWDWKATFGYWDPEKNEALLKESLFGN